MNTIKATKTTKSTNTEIDFPTSTVPRRPGTGRRLDIRRVQTVLLVWLDGSIKNDCDDCQNTIEQLKQVVTNINTFTDPDQCIQFIQSMVDNKICMIVSGALGQHMVPCVHAMSQVDSVFIFCTNQKLHELWAGEWPKVKGVFTAIPPICDSIKQIIQQSEHNATRLSFVSTDPSEMANKNFDRLDWSFVFTQVLKEISLATTFDEKPIKEFLNVCLETFHGNERELRFIERLKRHYREHRPIWWYTYRCFLYPMLNQTLRTMDVEVIMQMGFFIGDLHRDIERLHSKQYTADYTSQIFTVYRGQGVSKADFQRMSKIKDGWVSFNNFLIASKDLMVSLRAAKRAARNPELVGVLFIMTIDPAEATIPFASITEVSHNHAEKEVLFSMHAVFRIHEIKPMTGSNHIYEVRLTLASNRNKELRELTDWIREETFPDERGWYRLGLVLTKTDQFAQAERICEVLLSQATNENQVATIHYELGRLKYSQGQYKEAIASYDKALTIRQKTLPPNHLDFASFYNNIGLAYKSVNDYANALLFYKKALEIQQQSLSGFHLNLSASYNNIGNLYDNMGDFTKALMAHEKALTIRQQVLPVNHPDLAFSYNSIGLLFDNMGEHAKALIAHEKALEIRHQVSPPNLTDLASSYNNIGNTYDNMGKYSKALASYERSLEILQKTLPFDHPDLAMTHYNIALVYQNINNHSKARSHYEHAVEIAQQSLPSDHPHLQLYQKNLDEIKKKL